MDTTLANKTAAEINAANSRQKGADGTGGELPSRKEDINNNRVLAKRNRIKGPDGNYREVTEHSEMGMPNDAVLSANHVSEMNIWLNSNHVGGRQQNAKGKEHPVYLQQFKCGFCDEKFNHLLQSLCTDEKHKGYDFHVQKNHGPDLQAQWQERAGALHRDDVVESKDEEFELLREQTESQADEIETLKSQMEALIAVNEGSKPKDK